MSRSRATQGEKGSKAELGKRDTNARNLVIVDNFKVLVCVSDKIDVLGREHLQVIQCG